MWNLLIAEKHGLRHDLRKLPSCDLVLTTNQAHMYREYMWDP